jgi:HlyD family secretion protein
MARKRSRLILIVGAVAVVAIGLVLAFLPHPTLVDIGDVVRGPMMVTIDEEGQTEVDSPFVVSAPITGQLLRVTMRAGDAVVQGETVVARMLPANPAALDVRSREQANASVDAAAAALRLARANLTKAVSSQKLTARDLAREQQLLEKGLTTRAALDSATSSADTAAAAVTAAEAEIAAREADLANARALLIGFGDAAAAGAGAGEEQAIPLYAPATGSILAVMQQSATTLTAGTPIMQIGNIREDLQVVCALLSTDAVQVAPGERVLIGNWGGPAALEGVVDRVDPNAFTKVSALGVEEQRVNVFVRFTGAPETRASLGNGFRVEVRIVTWEDADALVIPSSALFRDGEAWAAFVVEGGRAVLHRLDVGHNNGVEAEVLGGLEAGARVVLYPSSGLADGQLVAQRALD